MEENNLVIAILREIRDNTARTNERVDHLTERVDAQGAHINTLAAVQIRQAQQLGEIADILRGHTERFDRHEEILRALVHETQRIHARIDHIYEGPVVYSLRDHEARLRRLEERSP